MERVRTFVVGVIAMAMGVSCSRPMETTPQLESKWTETTVFDLDATALGGGALDLAAYRGKVLLIVNVASACGFTPQYKGLQSVYETYADEGLVVIGFPSNEFGKQEAGTDADIASFCSSRFGVTFPMGTKLSTQEGEDQSPVYECLGTKTGKLPGWNFCKYLVSRDGTRVSFFASQANPTGVELNRAIKRELAASSTP
jgi:glutathione peroxidase